jgi:hypothetical protein
MKKPLSLFFFLFCITLLGKSVFAQPNISYSPSTEVYTLNTAITGPVLSNSGGAVAAFAYGTGTQPTGGAFNNPYGMGTDPSGNIYVINYGNNTISKYSSATGAIISNNFFTGGSLSNPAGIAFDSSGNAYILSYNHTNNGNGNNHGNAYIEKYNSAGVYQSTIVQGLGTGTGIAIDLNNNIYIAEGSYNGGNQTVAQYNTSGQLAFSLSSTQITNPTGVGVDGAGNIYVLDDTYHTVTKFNSAGTYISTVITGLGNNTLGIYVDGAGNIYIGDSGTGGATGNTSGSVKVYNSSGALLVSKTGLNDPEGLVTDNKGNLFVSDYTNNTITKYPPVGGYYLSGLLPAGLSFNSTTGAFSGTPTVAFSATNYTVTAYNASGSSISNVITLSCPANLSAPDISYVPAINVFTKGTAITALAPVNGGGAPTSFTISPTTLTASTGLTFSTSTGTFSGTPNNTAAATIYTVTASNASGSSTTTVSVACVVDNYWTGKKSNDWGDSRNWNAKNVPITTDLASIGVINYTGPDPVISTNTNAYYVTFGPNAGPFTVQSGATFTINNILTINNNATPILQGATSSSAGSINIVPAAVVNVLGTGTLTVKSPLTFTLQSDATGSAQVSQMTTGSITGTVSVQRYITGYRGYRLLSSPVSTSATSGLVSVNYLKNSCYVTGTTGAAGGFDVGAVNNPTLYLFRENILGTNSAFTSSNFRGVNNLTTTPAYGIDVDGAGYNIYEGNGYMFFFRGDRNLGLTLAQENASYVPTNVTLTATGTLNQGQIAVKNWYTGSTNLLETTVSANMAVEGFNLVGNPYASSIDWDSYSTSLPNTTGIYAPGIAPFIYILKSNGTYNVYQANKGGVSTGGIANSNIIPSGQGFFVQATGATPSITFNESAKVITQAAGANLFLGTPPAPVVNQYLQLFLAQNAVNEDGILINFNSNAKPEYVRGEDAPYKPGTGTMSIASLSADNVSLAVNTLSLPKLNPLVIPLTISANTDGSYQLNMATIKSVPMLYDVWLMDAYTKDSVDLRKNPVYSFDIARSIGASYGSGRFSVVIRENPALQFQLLNFTAAKASNGVQVTWKTQYEQNYTYFTVERSNDDGKTYVVVGSRTSDGSGAYGLLDSTPPTGSNKYRLKIEDLNGAITYSDIVTVTFGNSAAITVANTSVNAYPSPTHGTVTLTVNQTLHDPSYIFNVLNNLGVVVKSGSSNQLSWQTDISDLLPGTYFIMVLNKMDNSVVGKTAVVKL